MKIWIFRGNSIVINQNWKSSLVRNVFFERFLDCNLWQKGGKVQIFHDFLHDDIHRPKQVLGVFKLDTALAVGRMFGGQSVFPFVHQCFFVSSAFQGWLIHNEFLNIYSVSAPLDMTFDVWTKTMLMFQFHVLMYILAKSSSNKL